MEFYRGECLSPPHISYGGAIHIVTCHFLMSYKKVGCDITRMRFFFNLKIVLPRLSEMVRHRLYKKNEPQALIQLIV